MPATWHLSFVPLTSGLMRLTTYTRPLFDAVAAGGVIVIGPRLAELLHSTV